MAERNNPAAGGNGHSGGRSRTWTAPVRAMTRIIGADGSPPPTPTNDVVRSAVVDCALYVDGVRQEGPQDYASALAAAREQPNAFVWLGLHEPSEAEMAPIAEAYGLHELAVEDAIKAEQRPKLERFNDVVFLVCRTARYLEHGRLTEHSEVVETGQVLIFIGPAFVITVRHGNASKLSPVRADLEARQELLAQGPWAVAYAVTDRIVDHYIEVADGIEDDLDALEEDVFSRAGTSSIQSIYQLKRELVEFRRAVVPFQRPLLTLTSDASRGTVPKEIRRYFRDVQDHLSRTIEQVTANDDLLNSILQARLAQVSVDQNNDMRKIAAWAAIATVWTAAAGIYGMNFKFMPELEWRYSYPVLITLLVITSATLYRLFRRNGWL
ncbi:magnesium/cobalt transporter CorA [Catenuloplanes indicus]|nr:magnesium/cobalt transporter CorA [Catenuloplanes indicus]